MARDGRVVWPVATFVLVHGAMHGGWCWAQVRRRLTAAGHEVFTPSLTGQGERRDALTREVGPATHVRDLTDLLWFEDLTDVHMVLHSYAGVLAGPLAEAAIGRLASLTYLAGFVVEPGECLLDVEPSRVADRYRQLARDQGEGWFLPPAPAFLEQWGIPDDRRAHVGERLTAFPLRCQTEPVHYAPAPLTALPLTYLRHTRPPLESLDLSYARAVRAGWDIREIACGHDVMLAEPDRTAELLEAIAHG
ncbi:alpha/beta hydrolase family protein [Streptomyces sp. NPDC048636]|uniref:alpha/beta fold hydrolase n=1 Tax=Streptomyces sp. NPDC048636 TaxID=3155762 RepID=UPI0034307E65